MRVCEYCGKQAPPEWQLIGGYASPAWRCPYCGKTLDFDVDANDSGVAVMMINWAEYVDFTNQVAVYPDAGTGSLREMAYIAMGLAGETGEVVDQLKKVLRVSDVSGGEANNASSKYLLKASEELGDLMWYVARLCQFLDLDLQLVLNSNMAKLSKRQEQGTLAIRGEAGASAGAGTETGTPGGA